MRIKERLWFRRHEVFGKHPSALLKQKTRSFLDWLKREWLRRNRFLLSMNTGSVFIFLSSPNCFHRHGSCRSSPNLWRESGKRARLFPRLTTFFPRTLFWFQVWIFRTVCCPKKAINEIEKLSRLSRD